MCGPLQLGVKVFIVIPNEILDVSAWWILLMSDDVQIVQRGDHHYSAEL